MDERVWKLVQWHLSYSDDEMALFRANPRNVNVLSKGRALTGNTIVAEVVEAHGCNSRHKVGDRFYFDGAGNLVTQRCPKKVCVHILSAAATLIFAASELFFAGVNPNEMHFKRAGCIDVGLRCGGWGKVVVEVTMEDREEPEAS
jgi:uncharacterized repeat protein (TIGR04076 family)